MFKLYKCKKSARNGSDIGREVQTIIKEVALEYERVAADNLNQRQVASLENMKNPARLSALSAMIQDLNAYSL